MHRLPLLALAALATFAAGSGCDGLGPSDEPLPTVAELRAEFDRQPPGRAFFIDDNDERYRTVATYTTRTGDSPLLGISLRSEETGFAISLLAFGVSAADIQVGDELPVGNDEIIGITAIEDGRIEGVFAVEYFPSLTNPGYSRYRGAFNAVPDTTGS